VNWFTIIAQIVNFLILVFLLRALLYRRIVSAMDARQQRIADALHEADQHKAEADREARHYRAQNEELEARRAALLDEAVRDADQRRKDLTHQAKDDVARLKGRWERTVREESEQFLTRLRESVGEQACAVARRALAEVADADLEDRVAAAFLSRLAALESNAFTEALAHPGASATVVSAFPAPPARQQQVSAALRRWAPNLKEVCFETDPALVCGIKVRADGQVIEWSLAGYVDELSEALRAEVQDEAGTPEGATTDGP